MISRYCFGLLPILVIVLAAGCGRKAESRSNAATVRALPAASVKVRKAEIRKQASTEEVAATIKAKTRTTLEAKVSGRIDKLPVALGQTIKAGQLVASLDAAEIKARLEQAEAALQQAERDWKRISALFDAQASTRSEADAAEARYRVAKAGVAEARAMISYVEVAAPFDGVVTKKWVDIGDLAVPGKPLVDMEDPSDLQLEADVPEAIASRVERNARLAVRADSLSGELVGVVAEIAPAADPITRTLRVKLSLPQTPGLKSGQFARLLVPTGENSSVTVPLSALVRRGQLEIVFVAAGQNARLHLVKTGKQTGDEIEILAGLDAGDLVVIDGATLLVDGQPLEVK